jgi:PAS domain-containing protein
MKNRSAHPFPPVDKNSFVSDNDASKTNALHNELLHLPDVVIQTDNDFKITGWNVAAEKICNLSGTLGKSFFELDNMIFSDDSVALMKKRFHENGIWNGNIRCKRNEGGYIHFRSAAHYITNENSTTAGIVITNHNITQQLITEQKLAETEAMYKMVIDALDEAVLIIEATGMIMAANKKAIEILGVDPQKILGQIPVSGGKWKVFRLDGSPFPDCELPVVVSLQTGFPQKNVEMQIEKPDGRSFSISVSSQAIIREGEFNPYAVVVSFFEITGTTNKAGI